MISIEEALEKFNSLPPEIILEVDSNRVADKIAVLESKYGVKLSSLIILVTIGALMEDRISPYIQAEFALKKTDADILNKALWETIFDPLLKRLHFLDNDPGKESISFNEEKILLLEMFEKDIANDLNNNPIIIDAINSRIFYILSKELGFKKNLEEALYRNEEKITSKTIIADERQFVPNIGNWLKEFIRVCGASMPDNMVITEFMINSKNAKLLSQAEKSIVQKVVSLYRNLKFFPESMPSDGGEGWEILPLEDDINEKTKTRPIGPPKTESEKKIDELKQEEAQYESGSFEEKAIEERIEVEKRIEELEIEAKQYVPGSLEERAIKEEIRRLRV